MSELELREEAIIPLMYIIRAEKVILDRDLGSFIRSKTGPLNRPSDETEPVSRPILCSN